MLRFWIKVLKNNTIKERHEEGVSLKEEDRETLCGACGEREM